MRGLVFQVPQIKHYNLWRVFPLSINYGPAVSLIGNRQRKEKDSGMLTVQFGLVPNFEGEHSGGGQRSPTNLTRGLAARWLFRVPPCRKGTIHLQTSMPSPGFEPRHYDTDAQNEIAVVPDFHKRILFSDEAHFWLNGYVNKQNCRIWSEANPQVYVETPLHPEKLTVWCALWSGGIIGPYFFKNDEGHNVTVNGDLAIEP
ncbi:uncharacterized protein TNCV_3708671 [Trichonephila clavipes]|nr:uncharacterized protein TNCV_3708671 [Trichonephila clavipes]